MAASYTDKGVAHGWTLGENNWKDANDESQLRISAMLLNAWAQKRSTTTGLTYGYHGGMAVVAGAFSVVADGTTALADATTNYVERTAAGVVTDNTTGFSADKIPMAIVVTAGGAITSVTDRRPPTAQLPQEVPVLVAVPDLAANADIANTAFFVARTAMTVAQMRVVNGATAAAGVDGGNTVVVIIRNLTEGVDIATLTLTANIAANAASVAATLTGANVDIAAGDVLGFSVTQGATADMGPFTIQTLLRP